MIGGRYREIAFLVARPVSKIVLLAARIPPAFFGVDEIEAGVLVLIEPDVVEDEEFRLGAEKRGVATPLFCRYSSAFLAIQRGSRS